MCIVYMYGAAEVTLRDRVAAEPLERTAVETTNSLSATAPTAKQTSTSFHRPTPEKHRQNTTFNQSTESKLKTRLTTRKSCKELNSDVTVS